MRRHHLSHRPSLGLTLGLALPTVLVVLALPAIAEDSAGAPTCDGLAATIVAGDEPDVTGTEGDDVIVSTSHEFQTIHGLGGHDAICPGDGFGVDVYGDEGDDRLFVQQAGAQGFGGPGNDELTGSPGTEHLHGGLGNDVMRGLQGSDRLWGDEGDDWVSGGGGRDEVLDGLGDDVSVGGLGRDYLVQEYTSPDGTGVTLDIGAGTVAGGGGAGTFAGFEAYGGSDYPDVLRGSPARDDLYADVGDVALGRGSDDLIHMHGAEAVGGKGDDELHALNGGIMRGGPGEDRLMADFDGAEGPDSVPTVAEGEGGDDVIAVVTVQGYYGSGGELDLRAAGGSGRNVLTLADAYSVVTADLGDRTAVLGFGEITWQGIQRFVGSGGADRIAGSGGRDEIAGGPGPDTIGGGGGSDLMYGGRGADVLRGGRGIDIAHGQGGVDTCRAERRHGCERR